MGDDMLRRGLRLLTALTDHPGGVGVSAAARAAALPVSSAHRLLGLMAEEGYVAYDPAARSYALGYRALELARGFSRSPAGFQDARGPMRRLAARTGLAAIAGILDRDEVLLVLSVDGRQHLQLRSEEGTRNAWHATSLGKALVAALPTEDQERLLAAPLKPSTPRTVVDPAALRDELATVAGRGWAEVEEENEVGVRSIAVCVPSPDPSPDPAAGQPRLAISLGATVLLTGREELRTHVPALQEAAREVAAGIP
ncbi:IclR family transcriptional regulator [Phaeacidiphilus oryzae]|uniref:IclR family transcriptional regulator n=1 Tax=Phaeacidiphilus oryzae TaxID=348818 RepID=UPI000B07F8B2|nr:IclR family transcriptional regulator [Phaeacidiphilus oryzae]